MAMVFCFSFQLPDPSGRSHSGVVLCYRFTLYAVDTRGRHSELSTVTLRTACPLVDDNKAEGKSLISAFIREVLPFPYLHFVPKVTNYHRERRGGAVRTKEQE